MNIEILLPSPRGYCAGVNRAIEILDKVLKQYKK
jgi:4-hydroxy-3-methylbut-2-enyl diphosphate reductase IspH